MIVTAARITYGLDLGKILAVPHRNRRCRSVALVEGLSELHYQMKDKLNKNDK